MVLVFLRSSDASYLAGPDDYLCITKSNSPFLILEPGDSIAGKIRPPKEG